MRILNLTGSPSELEGVFEVEEISKLCRDVESLDEEAMESRAQEILELAPDCFDAIMVGGFPPFQVALEMVAEWWDIRVLHSVESKEQDWDPYGPVDIRTHLGWA